MIICPVAHHYGIFKEAVSLCALHVMLSWSIIVSRTTYTYRLFIYKLMDAGEVVHPLSRGLAFMAFIYLSDALFITVFLKACLLRDYVGRIMLLSMNFVPYTLNLKNENSCHLPLSWYTVVIRERLFSCLFMRRTQLKNFRFIPLSSKQKKSQPTKLWLAN